MTTVAEVVIQTRRELSAVYREEMNQLLNDISPTDTQINLQWPVAGVTRGSRLSIGDEVLYVWAVDGGGTISVLRGDLGTTKVAHTAATSVVYVNPRFPNYAIKDALKKEIATWGPDLFRVSNGVVIAAATGVSRTFDLVGVPADFYEVLDVYTRESLSASSSLSHNWRRVHRFQVFRNVPTSEFPSGSMIQIATPMLVGRSSLVTCDLAIPFDLTTFDDATDLEADCGLSFGMVDIAVFGASWRLMSGQEAVRSDLQAQGESRRPEEVQVGAALNVAAGLKRMRDDRFDDEVAALRAKYPWRAF